MPRLPSSAATSTRLERTGGRDYTPRPIPKARRATGNDHEPQGTRRLLGPFLSRLTFAVLLLASLAAGTSANDVELPAGTAGENHVASGDGMGGGPGILQVMAVQARPGRVTPRTSPVLVIRRAYLADGSKSTAFDRAWRKTGPPASPFSA